MKKKAGGSRKASAFVRPSGRGELAKLYQEVQAVKMAALSAVLKMSRNPGLEQDPQAARLSQLILKAVEIQVRLLGETEKRADQEGVPAEVAVIWEAMTTIPELKALLSRESMRRRIMTELKNRLSEESDQEMADRGAESGEEEEEE